MRGSRMWGSAGAPGCFFASFPGQFFPFKNKNKSNRNRLIYFIKQNHANHGYAQRGGQEGCTRR